MAGSTPEMDNVKEPRKRRWWRRLLWAGLILVLILIAVRLALPIWVRSYVVRTIDEDPLYEGKIGSIDMRLLQGGYTIHDVRLNKRTGNVPVPFFSAKRIDLVLQWDALLHGKFVGTVVMKEPELNFVDAEDPSEDQTGAEGPWLQMIRDLYPMKINSAKVEDGSIHFRAFHTNPPVDIFLNDLQASVDNLTNIRDEVKPMITSVHATAKGMDQAKFEFDMQLNPFSYRPSFQLALRLIGLDVTQINALSRAYGQFDFERGFFDLILELDAKEGQLTGYIKPLFQRIQVLGPKDLKYDNPLEFFWEALVGVTINLLKNQSRDQFATVIPLDGDLSTPQTNFLTILGNVLRNAFIRAYLPRFEGTAPDVNWLRFKPGSVTEPLPARESP